MNTPEMFPETRARIEDGLANWNDPTSPARIRFEKAEAYWTEKLRPMLEAIEASEKISSSDLAIVINVR